MAAKRVTAASPGQRPDPAGFLHPRPDGGTAPDDPLRAAKVAAVPRSELLGRDALGAARQFVRAAGSGRGVRIADDTIVAQAAAKVAQIRKSADLTPAGKQAQLGAVGQELQQRVDGVLGLIANTRAESA